MHEQTSAGLTWSESSKAGFLATIYEPHQENLVLCICENKGTDKLISTFVFAMFYIDSTSPLLPKSKFEASSHLLQLYSPDFVGPHQKKACIKPM